MKTKGILTAAALLAASVTGTAQAWEEGDWLMRFGVSNIDPKSNNHPLVSVDDANGFTINFSHMLTENWALELLAAYPYEHDISLKGGPKVASTKHLPPTITAQYYPLGANQQINPYVGIGLNYTNFFEEDTTPTLTGAVDAALGGGVIDATELELDDSFGIAAELGVDVQITDQLGVNAAMWWADIDTTADIHAISDGQRVGTAKVDVEIDPMVYMIGLSYKF